MEKRARLDRGVEDESAGEEQENTSDARATTVIGADDISKKGEIRGTGHFLLSGDASWSGAHLSIVVEDYGLVLDLGGHTLSIGHDNRKQHSGDGHAAIEVMAAQQCEAPVSSRARENRRARARFVLRNGRLLVHGCVSRISNLLIVGMGDVLLEKLSIDAAPASSGVEIACCGRAILARTHIEMRGSASSAPFLQVGIRCSNRLSPEARSACAAPRTEKARDVCGLSLFGCSVTFLGGYLPLGLAALGLRCLRVCQLRVTMTDKLDARTSKACLAAQCQNVVVYLIDLTTYDEQQVPLLLDSATSKRGVFCDYSEAPQDLLRVLGVCKEEKR